MPPSEKPPSLVSIIQGGRAVVDAVERAAGRDWDAPGFIYVRQAPIAPTTVKIGWENRPYAALRALNRAHSTSLKTLVLFPGTIREEKQLHRQFEQFNVGFEAGVEHFALTPTVRRWLDQKIREFGEARAPDRKETCEQWLQRVGTHEAQHNLATYKRFRQEIDPLRDPTTRGYALWQICAGIKHGRWRLMHVIGTEGNVLAPLESYYVVGGHPFYVFKEACDRFRVAIPPRAITAGVIPLNHRRRGHDKGAAKRRVLREVGDAQKKPCVDEPLFSRTKA